MLNDAAPRMRLSLRWKAFGAIFLLLGIVHTAFGLLVYRQEMNQYRQQEREHLGAFRQQLEALLDNSAHALGTVGAQIASGASLADARQHPFDTSQLAPEVLASLSDLRIFDAQGWLVGGIATETAVRLPSQIEQKLIDSARNTHRPVAVIHCSEECVQYSYEPAFDRNGIELMVGLGQPVAETLREFSRQSGADVALLANSAQVHPPGPASRIIGGRRLFAVTDAPRLLPWLRAVAPALRKAPDNQPYAASDGRFASLTLATPLDGASDIQVLFILDETASLARIRDGVRAGVASSLLGLTLSAGALWLFLTPLSRRLTRISSALPLLADQKFAQARELLPRRSKRSAFADELDVLTQTTHWLSYKLERLDAAEAASEAKSRFLAEMSHEVRTPLHGILGMLELLQHSSLDQGQSESLRMVHESAQSLLRIVDDTLDLARIEAGRIELNSEPFSIVHVVEGCAETFASRARGKNIRLLNYIDPALPPLVLGDAMRLRQILSNLCNNAVKFTAAGRVAVCARIAETTAERVRVRFSVLDTGIGIAPLVQAKLFQPFRQASAATAATYGGSGLGLSICQGLVQRMGGRIGLESTPGKGTEFWFQLDFPLAVDPSPVRQQRLDGVVIGIDIADATERSWIVDYLRAAGARIADNAVLRVRDNASDGISVDGGSVQTHLPHPQHRSALLRALALAAGLAPVRATKASTAAKPARRLRILAVDDHPTNQHVIQHQLSLLGHDAELAANGEEALRRLDGRDYDLLLTDLRMPGLDGYGVAREIRRREAAGERSGRLPILAMTAQVASGEQERCSDAGMDGQLSKPSSLEDLHRALAPWSDTAASPGDLPAKAEPGTSESPLDRAALAELLGGDAAIVADLARDFLRINAPLVEELDKLGRQNDYPAVEALAHRLLGSARTLGAKPLARILSELEIAAAQKRDTACRNLAQQAGSEFNRVREYLQVNVS